jgi:hypothetical protein
MDEDDSKAQKQKLVDELFADFAIVLLAKGRDVDVGGNAVIIAPNIAITAAHILLNNKFGSFSGLDTSAKEEVHYPEDNLHILMNSRKYKKGYLLNVSRVVFISDSDLAVLYLNPLDDTPDDIWNDITLNLTPPDIDSRVFTLGSKIQKTDYSISNGTVNIKPKYVGSIGTVIQFMLKNPLSGASGFYAKLTTFNTLSGSPVYNQDDELVGLISHGYEGETEDSSTFVSVLYPLFTTSYTLNGDEAFHLYNLASQGVVRCMSLDRVKIDSSKVNLTLPKSLKE